MSDERIERTLRELPQETAGSDFTAQVLERLDHRPRRAVPLRWAMATAAACLVFVAVSFTWPRDPGAGPPELDAQARLEMLLAEKTALEEELRSLRRMADGAQPLVYLGSNNDVDLVLDLSRLHRRTDLHPRPEKLEAGAPHRAAGLPHGLRPQPRPVVY